MSIEATYATWGLRPKSGFHNTLIPGYVDPIEGIPSFLRQGLYKASCTYMCLYLSLSVRPCISVHIYLHESCTSLTEL